MPPIQTWACTRRQIKARNRQKKKISFLTAMNIDFYDIASYGLTSFGVKKSALLYGFTSKQTNSTFITSWKVMSCTELWMAVRTIGIISTEGAQQTLCSQLADNSMTTVKKKKQTTICFIFILLHLKLFSPWQPAVLRGTFSIAQCNCSYHFRAQSLKNTHIWYTDAFAIRPTVTHSSTLLKREGWAFILHPAALVCTSTGAFISNSPAISTNISRPVQHTHKTKQTSKFMDSCHASNSYRIKKNGTSTLHSTGNMTYLTSEMTEHILKSAVMHCTVETARLTAPLTQSPQLRDHFGRPKEEVSLLPSFLLV